MCPLPDDGSVRMTGSSAGSQLNEFSSEERAWLLQLAHDSIAAGLERRQLEPAAPSAHLAEPRGVFTTLYCRGALRGCVGFVLPRGPLHLTVAESARGAAFDDARFPPVRREELTQLRVSLSVLSAVKPIDPSQIEIGRHGLLITLGAARGLLLPQVAVEHEWDGTAFLEQTCRKAGLPLDAWQTGALVEAFTAEVFADPDPVSS